MIDPLFGVIYLDDYEKLVHRLSIGLKPRCFKLNIRRNVLAESLEDLLTDAVYEIESGTIQEQEFFKAIGIPSIDRFLSHPIIQDRVDYLSEFRQTTSTFDHIYLYPLGFWNPKSGYCDLNSEKSVKGIKYKHGSERDMLPKFLLSQLDKWVL